MSCSRPPLSVLTLAAFEALLVVPLLLPSFRHRGVIVVSILSPLAFAVFASTTGDAATDWSIGLAVLPQLLKAIYVYALHNAEADFWRNGEEPGSWQSFNLWKKCIWAFELINTPRGVGWNWEIPYVCYVGTETRRNFLWSRGLRITLYIALLAVAGLWHPSLLSAPVPSGSPISFHSFLPVWSFLIGSYAQLWLVHTVPAFLMVILRLDCHKNYPYVMGPLGAMNSIRTLWGRTWHQAVRAVITAFGKTIGKRLIIASHGSTASAYIQLATGFIIGALTHALAGYMASGGCETSDKTGATRFFFLQFCAIVAEDAIFCVLCHFTGLQDWRVGHMDGGKMRYGVDLQIWNPKSFVQLVGYLAVVSWLSWTLPPYLEGLRSVGALESQWALLFRFT